ncbi:MAG: hypothetical protein ABSA68_13120 [Xanthobacteraceae bacterium]|jgi:hypothetical protein
MPGHVIVWDLETVPDIAGYAAANGLTGKSNEEIREAIGNKFPQNTSFFDVSNFSYELRASHRALREAVAPFGSRCKHPIY